MPEVEQGDFYRIEASDEPNLGSAEPLIVLRQEAIRSTRFVTMRNCIRYAQFPRVYEAAGQ